MIKHDLIEQVGGIEKAREIVEGAPDSHYCTGISDYTDGYDDDEKCPDCVSINDLRTAIAEHGNPQLCIECGSPDLHKGGEIKEPKMCFKCYAAMTGFTLFGDQLIEDDELAEIAAGHRIESNNH